MVVRFVLHTLTFAVVASQRLRHYGAKARPDITGSKYDDDADAHAWYPARGWCFQGLR